MTRRKKNKSSGSGNGAATVSAPAQVAADSLQDNAVGPDVIYSVPTCPRTGYSLLAPRPVYPVLVSRPVPSSPAPRTVHHPQGPRPMNPATILRPVTVSQPVTAPRSGTISRPVITPQPATAPQPVTTATGTKVPQQRRVSQVDSDLRVKSSAGSRPVITSCDRNSGTKSSSASTRSEDSVVSVASTNISDVKDKKKTKIPYKVKITYETKEINVYPRQPILMVERLQNLEYHVGELTEAIGRRPAVYPLGRRVRFVPETATEGAAIQRYLARIEAQERISWCSYSLPPGNSLKVTVKVKVVERIKIKDDLVKQKLQTANEQMSQEKEKVRDAKDVPDAISKQNGKKDKASAPKEKHITTSSTVNKDNIKKLTNATVNEMSTSSSGQLNSISKGKQQVVPKDKLGLTGSVQNTKVKANPNKVINKSAIKPGRRGQKHVNEPKKESETEKTAAAVKTAHERDNKLVIVGVVRTNKLLF